MIRGVTGTTAAVVSETIAGPRAPSQSSCATGCADIKHFSLGLAIIGLLAIRQYPGPRSRSP